MPKIALKGPLRESGSDREIRESDREKRVVITVMDFLSRRWLLLIIGWAGFLFVAGITTLLTFIDFYKPKVIFGPAMRFKAGYPEEYPLGEVSTRWMAEQRVWVVRAKEGIYAFLGICRHLGCTPRWVPEEQLFKCPCHGSNFNMEGDVVGGPAPRPLWRVGVSLSPDGQVVVDKSVKEDRVGVREKGKFILPV
ncbi:MAG TPA: ubiquinol-cytochrome c reductase iron-sulfur subunit [Candidatus Brocadiales bacterium]|nr:ubiquinol-cytochrome c reductase iron-sulfur subunit [Candidatus Brocadiales bacterium]